MHLHLCHVRTPLSSPRREYPDNRIHLVAIVGNGEVSEYRSVKGRIGFIPKTEVAGRDERSVERNSGVVSVNVHIRT